MVLIYNKCTCVFHNITTGKVCAKFEIPSHGKASDIVLRMGIEAVGRLEEQIKISERQTTRKLPDLNEADNPKFVANHTGFEHETDNFLHKIKTSERNHVFGIFEKNQQRENTTSEFATELSAEFNGDAVLNLSREKNQQTVHNFETPKTLKNTSFGTPETLVDVTPLQFSYGFDMTDRLRRNVFGKDTRIHIGPVLTQLFPFSAVVRLGTGCTGTLIWHKHVLTAAHCIHDGKKLRPPLWKLKVGLLRRSGTFKWMNVKRAFVAKAWVRNAGIRRIAHDYAVLELSKPHGRPYMSFGSHSTQQGRMINFAGFPADKPVNQMWFSYCSVQKQTKKILYNYCDAMPGMSGSGVYVYDKSVYSSGSKRKSNRKVVAIFSSFVEWRYKGGKIRRSSNTATRLTPKKVERICRWIDAGEGCKYMKS